MSIEQSEMAPRSKDEQREREATNVIDGNVIDVIEAPSPGRGGPYNGVKEGDDPTQRRSPKQKRPKERASKRRTDTGDGHNKERRIEGGRAEEPGIGGRPTDRRQQEGAEKKRETVAAEAAQGTSEAVVVVVD